MMLFARGTLLDFSVGQTRQVGSEKDWRLTIMWATSERLKQPGCLRRIWAHEISFSFVG